MTAGRSDRTTERFLKGTDMLSVLYTAEENAYREQVREFAESVVAPRAQEIEDTAGTW